MELILSREPGQMLKKAAGPLVLDTQGRYHNSRFAGIKNREDVIRMKIRLLLLLLALIQTLNGCSNDRESNVAHGTRHQILHLGNGTEPQEIDPHLTVGIAEFELQMALFEGLLAKDPQTLEPVPGVAESWIISPDGRSYTFKLRRDARWSNGDALTARDFMYAWKRALMPALASQYAYSLYGLKNAERFNKGEITDFTQVGVSAPDDYTLQVDLVDPIPYFLQLLDHNSMFPVHQATIEKFGRIDERGTRWTRPGNFVGNGPFALREWTPNKIITVQKNPHYWDASRVRLNEIRFYPVQESSIEERMFRAGQLHITEQLPLEKTQGYRDGNSPYLYVHPHFSTYFYRFNTTIKPLDDARVRRALALSIDRERIVEKVTRGGQLPAYNLTPPDTMGYTAEAKLEFNIEKAQALLADAGYPGGKGFPALDILYNTQEGHLKIAQAIQQMWKQTLGVDVGLLNQEWKVFLDSELNMDYQISRSSWMGDYLDPNTFLDLFVSGGGNNRTGWGDPHYDELIAAAAKTGNREERYRLFQQAEKILMNAAVIAPIYTYTRVYLKSTDVKGWYPNILDYHPYKYIYLESSSKPPASE
jgi:oligopeptide transport system substrate-binding protein